MVFSSKEFASELRASLGKLHFRGHSKATEDCRRPRGVTRNLHDGGSDVFFFGLNIWTLGIFLGLEIRQVFFWVDKFQSDFFLCLIE